MVGRAVKAVALAVALAVGLTGPAGVADAAPPRTVPRAQQAQQIPLIEDVRPRDGAVEVSVELGDSPVGAVSQVTVTAWTVKDGGEPDTKAGMGTAPAVDRSNLVVITVAGLTNDRPYVFAADETTGTGVTSSPYFWGGPQTPQVPLPPTLDSVFGRDNGLRVTWNPAGDGGSAVLDYTVTATEVGGADPSATVTAAGTDTTVTVAGLSNGTAYTVSVAARNEVGTGSPGTSDATTTGATGDGTGTPKPPYAAGRPTDVSAGPPRPNQDGTQPDLTTLRVSWDAPADDGGATITGYTVTASAPERTTVTGTVPGTTGQTDLVGLVRDVQYSVTVTTLSSEPATVPATSDPVYAAPGPVLDRNTIELSAASINAITSVPASAVVFTNPPPQVRNLVKRNILFVAENSNARIAAGLLRAVVSVASDGTTWTVATSSATLDQAFPHLNVTAAGNDRPAGQVTVHSLDPRFRASLGSVVGKKWNIDIGEKINADPRMKEKLKGATITAKLAAELSITPDWKVWMGFARDPRRSWWEFWDLYTFTYHFRAVATAKASVRGELGIAYKYETEKTPLLTIESKPPSCPSVYGIQLCPKLAVYIQATIDGSIKFTFEATYERRMGGEVGRRADTSTFKNDLTTAPARSFTYNLQASVKVTIAFPVELQVLVFGLIGPKLTITPSLILTADTAANPWLKLDAGLKIDIHFVIDIKVKRWDLGGTVYNGTFPLWNSKAPFPGPSLASGSSAAVGARAGPPVTSRALAVSAAAPIRYTVVWPPDCDPGEGVSWSMRDGSLGTVDATGLYTPPDPMPPENFVDMVDAATDGTPTCPAVTVSAAVHYGASLPGPALDPELSPDGNRITWRPPADDGGSPITGYVVSVRGDPADPASSEYVLGVTAGNSTELAVPADRIPEIEWAGARAVVTALNDRGQGPDSDPSPPPPSTDPGLVVVAAADGLGGGITVDPQITNYGPDVTVTTQLQLRYPTGLGSPQAPANCTVDTAARTVTCTLAPLAAGDLASTPIHLTAGLLTIGRSLTVTAARTASVPYPIDPNDGYDAVTCAALTGLLVSCP
jgi:hypothetical protein